jgi:hypothetical protein
MQARRPLLRFGLRLIAALLLLTSAGSQPLASAQDAPQVPEAAKPKPVAVGDDAPAIKAQTHTGAPFELASLKGKRAALIAFFPRAFTPG